jgi:uncharacterized protein (TIGR01244 family)
LGGRALPPPAQQPRAAPPGGKPLAGAAWVSGQVALESVATLRDDGFAAIIDLRPDGESPDQPASSAMAAESGRQGLQFTYVPVPRSEIPDAAVDALVAALASAKRPVLLYCGSGRRASRTWALAEASRAGGLQAGDIEAVLSRLGQPVEDLRPRIDRRVAARSTVSDARPH